MSYDVSIGTWGGNFTHNSLGPLCYDHLDKEAGLKSLNGLAGYEAAPFLTAFWASVDAERHSMWENGNVGEPQLCEKYDSPNGWGSLVGALVFMGQLTAACSLYPKSKISVDA
jgi:hypothetical protein